MVGVHECRVWCLGLASDIRHSSSEITCLGVDRGVSGWVWTAAGGWVRFAVIRYGGWGGLFGVKGFTVWCLGFGVKEYGVWCYRRC